MDRAGWSSGVFRAVKLNQSVSISGPSATSKPMEPKMPWMRSSVSDTGCSPPAPRWRPGRETSSASALSWACSSASCQRLAALVERRFDGLLGQVDGSPARLFLFDGKLGHALHQLGHATGLAQKLGLGVFQIGGCGTVRKLLTRTFDQQSNSFICVLLEKKQGLVPFQSPSPCSLCASSYQNDSRSPGTQAASLALTCSTMLPKAALSCTARSASILRSISMAAFFRPLANWL
jgi:hypothetical protein